ncbi:single-stranded DNA-binding protein [Candidatus Peregrinibacteria bacterium]|jgi:single-strand DNA-binding protein|nr:single-stranded DNA-binding protein [Candidatus Peregrinibacteria bacterium]MBT4147782.1 single-stranded DNA-binding protein [Candidatus Peregrinibacteria bacterium]MBT4366325.1 single-stranded DNA-binding protein [Candidatus Peregrinibacteria bacterium]MBT4456532.1 single-stranded DNA-binding protein [Candidatus Peregrinibacteria bacterium]
MRSVNKVIIVGNLTRDPEMKQTPNGQSITTFGIATNREWVTQEGDRKQSAEFHECVAWAKLAEICEKYLKKSKLVYVEGYLKTRSWDTEEGVRKFKTEIVVEDMIMLNKREDSDGEYISKSEDKPAEETTAETPAEAEAPAEETPAETPVEAEAPAEETPAEETPADSDENPIDKDLGL